MQNTIYFKNSRHELNGNKWMWKKITSSNLIQIQKKNLDKCI
ncbi:hypothetical protein BD31_I1095 [Candidatus Nitrosopumilus salaria BD31]|uniref:Uncharacterized protein n=1 Tax=Candidatus Nitrosopumilus salarius BD31 TaxID=859350 RepID=I3D4L4_9ARCH|nr:hypothetical protein BD31_I1095 [Candidatus Nitrosopumilus salaria BD31]